MMQIILTAIIILFAVYALLMKIYSNKTFILCYHKVDYYKSGYRGIVVEPEKFLKQMKFIHGRGYKTIRLEELAALVSAGKKIPRKTFVITFDDGYENFHSFALPALKKFNFRATVFVSAGFIGKVFQYPHQPEERHLDEKQIKEVLADVDFGAHTVNHPHLTSLPDEKAAAEIRDSRVIMERTTSKPVSAFCYPYGDYNDKIIQMVKQSGFKSACTTKFGLVDSKSKVYELPRIEFKEWNHMSMRDFFRNFNFYLKTFIGA